jgi:hypothetical protein
MKLYGARGKTNFLLRKKGGGWTDEVFDLVMHLWVTE